MFNPFNFGARPTPSSPKVFVLRTAARDSAHDPRSVLHPQLHYSRVNRDRETATTRIRFVRRIAARSAASSAARLLPTPLHNL